MENNIEVLDKKAARKERRKVARQATRAFSRIFFSLVVYILVAGLVLVAAETVLLTNAESVSIKKTFLFMFMTVK